MIKVFVQVSIFIYFDQLVFADIVCQFDAVKVCSTTW